jgi:hypothetical protein
VSFAILYCVIPSVCRAASSLVSRCNLLHRYAESDRIPMQLLVYAGSAHGHRTCQNPTRVKHGSNPWKMNETSIGVRDGVSHKHPHHAIVPGRVD